MKIQYFPDTESLHIEFRAPEVAGTRDLDADPLLDTDGDGNICGITIKHANTCADIPQFSHEYSAA